MTAAELAATVPAAHAPHVAGQLRKLTTAVPADTDTDRAVAHHLVAVADELDHSRENR